MRRLLFAAPALLVVALLQTACGSSSYASPIECDMGGVTCQLDSICCPSAQPFYCSSPVVCGNQGCYETLAEAQAVCLEEPSADGGMANAAYQCK